MKAIITTVPFGKISTRPCDDLDLSELDYAINPLGRKLRPEEVATIIGDADIVIAGTEPITESVMDACSNLKAICRVGIGLDSIDLVAARKRNIQVSYTPDAPSPAVAELSIGLMLDALRRISQVDQEIREGKWARQAGRRLSECKIGIIGCGRIGSQVINHLYNGFPGVEIFANDIFPNDDLDPFVTWVEKVDIYQKCDVISLHIPLTPETQNLISYNELKQFRNDAVLINTSRGGIVNEKALAHALENKLFQSAAVDVFEEEPYKGDFCDIQNIILTCHLGSMTEDCRDRMEIEATQEAIRFATGQALHSPVPEAEYALAKRLREKE